MTDHKRFFKCNYTNSRCNAITLWKGSTLRGYCQDHLCSKCKKNPVIFYKALGDEKEHYDKYCQKCKCKYEGCLEPIEHHNLKYIEHEYCINHICQNCHMRLVIDFGEVLSKYCSKCTCNFGDCLEKKEIDYEKCINHLKRCSHSNLHNYTKCKTLYDPNKYGSCSEHICAYPGCISVKKDTSYGHLNFYGTIKYDFCDKHTCNVNYCTLKVVRDNKCKIHICKVDKCEFTPPCPKHKCKGCLESCSEINYETKLCLKCTCQKELCSSLVYKSNIGIYKYCSDHLCKFMKRSTRCEQPICNYNSKACNEHICPNGHDEPLLPEMKLKFCSICVENRKREVIKGL